MTTSLIGFKLFHGGLCDDLY